MENWADRLGRAIRVPLIISLLASGPIALVSLVVMLQDLIKTAPWWVSLIVVLSFLGVALGNAALFDTLSEKRHPR